MGGIVEFGEGVIVAVRLVMMVVRSCLGIFVVDKKFVGWWCFGCGVGRKGVRIR